MRFTISLYLSLEESIVDHLLYINVVGIISPSAPIPLMLSSPFKLLKISRFQEVD